MNRVRINRLAAMVRERADLAIQYRTLYGDKLAPEHIDRLLTFHAIAGQKIARKLVDIDPRYHKEPVA